MGRFGVGDDSRVVLYSTTAPQWAARVWWMLRNYGFDNAAVLNGGFQKWAREGRPVETGPAKPRSAGQIHGARGPQADGRQGGGARRDRRRRRLHDQRAAAASSTPALAAMSMAGSGASRRASTCRPPRCSTPRPARFCRPPFRAKFDAVGAFDKKRVITYCGGGIAASTDALALVMLGHPDVKLYDASMSEWSNDDSLPMETGE